MKLAPRQIIGVTILILLATVAGTMTWRHFQSWRLFGWGNARVIASPDRVLAWRTVGSVKRSPGMFLQRTYKVEDVRELITNGVFIPLLVTNENDGKLSTNYVIPQELLRVEDGDYRKKMEPSVQVSSELSLALTKALLSPGMVHESKYDRACMFSPGVILSFEKGQKTVSLFICFECSGILVADNGPVLDFYSNDLRALMRRIFPKDEDL
jgi:hypothetical protein